MHDLAPIATIIQGAPLDIPIEGSGKTYIDLNNSSMEVSVKVTTLTGGDSADSVNISTDHLLFQSLFQLVTMEIGDMFVTGSNNLYPYRGLL